VQWSKSVSARSVSQFPSVSCTSSQTKYYTYYIKYLETISNKTQRLFNSLAIKFPAFFAAGRFKIVFKKRLKPLDQTNH
jgi:hypothetical protein